MGKDDVLPVYGDPHGLLDGFIGDVGVFFLVGAAGGAAFHFVRGLVDRGGATGDRLAAGFRAARANAPRVAGKFGAIGAAFSALEAATYLARGGEYTFTGSAAAAAAALGLDGLLRRGGGGPAAARGAFLGGACVLTIWELSQAQEVSHFEQSLARQKRVNGDRPALAALLRQKPDSSQLLMDGHNRTSWLRMFPRIEEHK